MECLAAGRDLWCTWSSKGRLFAASSVTSNDFQAEARELSCRSSSGVILKLNSDAILSYFIENCIASNQLSIECGDARLVWKIWKRPFEIVCAFFFYRTKTSWRVVRWLDRDREVSRHASQQLVNKDDWPYRGGWPEVCVPWWQLPFPSLANPMPSGSYVCCLSAVRSSAVRHWSINRLSCVSHPPITCQ